MERHFDFVPRLFFHEEDYGGISLKLRFPLKRDSRMDPLVGTGEGWLSDIVGVSYPTERAIQFVFYHDLGDAQGVKSKIISIDPHQDYLLEIHMGSLYPRPLPFLIDRGYDVDRASLLQIKLNGEIVGKVSFSWLASFSSHRAP